MKKLLSILLFLTALVWLAGPAYSASITLTTKGDHVTGDLRVITGTGVVNSADTLAVGLIQIIYVGKEIRDNTNIRATNPTMPHGISGTTITLYPTENGRTWEFYIIGR